MGVNSEFFRAIKTLAKTNPDTWESFVDSRSMQEVLDYVAERRFVTVYELRRDYGGPEEGGWYYDSGFAYLDIETTEEHADAIAEMMREVYQDNRNRYSVLHYRKPSDYEVRVENVPSEDWTDYPPSGRWS